MKNPADHFAAFVSPVAGSLVRRYGTSENLGQLADEKGAKTPHVDPSLVIPLTHEEWRLYGRDYRSAIAEGSLRLMKAADWERAEAAAHSAELARVKALAPLAEPAKAAKAEKEIG